MLMVGPPGAGKTLLARAMPGILPHLTIEEALDVTRIYSVADQLPPDTPLIQNRPFRAPHHTIPHAGLVGGGNWPHPGEISLAHRGVEVESVFGRLKDDWGFRRFLLRVIEKVKTEFGLLCIAQNMTKLAVS
jgi:hypothetical protein